MSQLDRDLDRVKDALLTRGTCEYKDFDPPIRNLRGTVNELTKRRWSVAFGFRDGEPYYRLLSEPAPLETFSGEPPVEIDGQEKLFD